MQSLTMEQMETIAGGGFWCGFAIGVVFGGALFGGPLLAGYLSTKAWAVCVLEPWL